MKKWKAADMKFVQLWNNDRYEPEVKNHTSRTMIYNTPDGESIHVMVNVEEGVVFLAENSKSREFFENDRELTNFIAEAQKRFDTKMDMGVGTSFIYGYGGVPARLNEYDNPNIEYIPIVFPDNEKFQNPRYKEKVERSLIEKGAIFIVDEEKNSYLAVIQRKNKPRSLKAFSSYIAAPKQSENPSPSKQEDTITITLPKWLGEKIGLQTAKNEVTFSTTLEKQTEKAILIKYNNKAHWLPKSKISIV